MTGIQLLSRLSLPKEIKESTERAIEGGIPEKHKDLLPLLCRISTANEAQKSLASLLGEDGDGTAMLSCYITAAAEIIHKKYESLGISEEIFFDTFSCFERYLKETFTKIGRLKFDRAHFCYRHLATTLFKLGALEYELRERNGEPIIATHIPFAADMSRDALESSARAAREFFGRYFPAEGERRITCASWLMSPNLRALLPEGSKILGFQDMFEIIETEEGNEGAITRIFPTYRGEDFSELCENTTLQKNAKKWLMDGKTIGSGFGVLKE